jgi:hypothetical protein
MTRLSPVIREAWGSYSLLRLLIGLAAATVFIAIVKGLLDWLAPTRDWLWSVTTVDQAVLMGVLGMLILVGLGSALELIWPLLPSVRRLRKNTIALGSALVVLLSLYVAYASFRNQSRLTAEIALNDEGSALFEIEMAHPEIRCLYFNYGYERANPCLNRLAASEEDWSFAIFYVEEGWFILTRAYDDRIQWGSNYAASIEYWAQDVSRDPSGLFSYYLISTSESLSDARETMRQAGVSIADPCQKYRHVWGFLEQRSVQPNSISGAARECGMGTQIVYQTQS